MIQRPQTIFLALVAIAMALVVYFPIWSKADIATNQTVVLTALSLNISKTGTEVTSQPTFYITIAALIACGLALFSISQFKNRMRQLFLGIVTTFAVALTMILSFYYVYRVGLPAFAPTNQGNYGLGFVGSVAGLFCNMVANRLIRRDEDLVRSSNRMR
jgi:glucan phosphoethanolaminetransferase (alkaline phosphatase superfamily)